MGIIHVTVVLRALPGDRKKYEADFLVNSGGDPSDRGTRASLR